MENVYFIGGSPCSGKSTVAEILAREYGLYCFKVDDHLDRYIESAAATGSERCQRASQLSPDEIWMREPSLQCTEELGICEDIFPFILSELKQLPGSSPVITEGAAYLPKLMKTLNISKDRYLSITPTPEFQVSHYRKRDWVPYVLEGCRDKAQAFSNWMERDILFARQVQAQCVETQYASIVNGGEAPVAELVHTAAAHFRLCRDTAL